MKKLSIILFVLLTGCAGMTNVKSSITWHDGKTIKINSKSDAIVTVKMADGEATVDNRGRPGILEQVLGGVLIGRPEK